MERDFAVLPDLVIEAFVYELHRSQPQGSEKPVLLYWQTRDVYEPARSSANLASDCGNCDRLRSCRDAGFADPLGTRGRMARDAADVFRRLTGAIPPALGPRFSR